MTDAWKQELLTKELVQEAVKNEFGENAQLDSYQIEDFLKKGENFASIVTSVKASFQDGEKKGSQSYIAKLNTGVKMGELIDEIFRHMYRIEPMSLADIVPKMNKELELLYQEPIKSPKCYAYSNESGREVVITEDLRTQNYRMFDKFKSVDLEHAIMIVEELGRFHASSLLLESKLPEKKIEKVYPTLKHQIWTDPDYVGLADFNNLMGGQFVMAKNIYKLINGGKDDEIVGWFDNLKNFYIHFFVRQCELKSDQFNVLLHGDCWINNMLFRYDEENRPIDYRLLDFQACRKSSPACDLVYLFYSSFSGELRMKYQRRLLVYYYMAFTKILLLAGIAIPFSLEELEAEIKYRIPFAFAAGIMILSSALVKPEMALDMSQMGIADDSPEVEEKRNKLLKSISENDEDKQRFINLFAEFKDIGLFKINRTIKNDYQWILSEDLVEKALKKDVGIQAKLQAFETRKFTEVGDKNLTTIISIKVHYKDGKEENQKSYLCKLNPGRKFESELLQHMSFVYAKENCFLRKIAPAMNKELEKLELPPIKVPQLYASSEEQGKEVLITDYLKDQGFKLADRMKSLESAHACLVLEELGRIHASSLLLEDSLGGPLSMRKIYKELVDPFMEEQQKVPDYFQTTMRGAVDKAKTILKILSGYDKVIYWLDSIKEDAAAILMAGFEPDNKKFNALIHGDCWTNNILFKCSESGSPIDVKLVDFQGTRMTSVARDLNYFFYTSLDSNVRQKNRQQFLVSYYQSFTKILLLAGKKIPFTFKELDGEVKKLRIFGCLSSILVVPDVVMSKEEVISLQGLSAADSTQECLNKREEGTIKYIINNESFKDRFISMIDEMVEDKVFF